MAETVLDLPDASSAKSGAGLGRTLVAIAWRNLWRNKRRTWLTVGGIAFAVWLLVFARSIQDGVFDQMISNAGLMMIGHAQVQHLDYAELPQMENTLFGSDIARDLLATGQFTHVNERAQAFALVSAGERSFGAQVVGVQSEAEAEWSMLAASAREGRYIAGPGEAYIGEVLARNIAVNVGDEMVVLGTAKEGGVAALALDVVGIFATGTPELDRAVLHVDIGDFREAWNMAPNESHVLVAIATSLAASVEGIRRLEIRDDGHNYLDWQELMPDAVQMWDMKKVSTEIMFYVIAIVVGFSVVNTFMMLVFERTPEMGMLMAIGMKPKLLMLQLQIEAALTSLAGVGLGTAIAVAIPIPLGATGFPFPIEAAKDFAMEGYQIPDVLYPAFSPRSIIVAGAIMFVGTQIAALVPGLRIFRLRPVEALRQEG